MAEDGRDSADETALDRERHRSRRRGHRFRRAATPIRDAIARAASGRGFAEPDVLMRWPEIVGAELAPVCRPLRVAYGRAPALGATLVVLAEGARATEIEHMAPRILERINSHYGYRAVSRLKLTQTAGDAQSPAAMQGGFAEPPRGYAPPPTPIPDPTEMLARAETITDGIRDPGLRRALTRLGARVMADRDPPDTPGRPCRPPCAT